MSKQPEALRHADKLDAHEFDEPHGAAAELRRLWAENEAYGVHLSERMKDLAKVRGPARCAVEGVEGDHTTHAARRCAMSCWPCAARKVRPLRADRPCPRRHQGGGGEHMTDREYLELAAKAAGIPLRDLDDRWDNWEPEPVRIHRGWNPLENDGDALRLAVKLRIHVRHFPHDVEAQVERGYWREDDGSDPYAATRRAIVRAAAEIGKGMK